EQVPGVVYGPSTDPKSVNVEPRELRKVLSGPHGMNALFKLDVDGDQAYEVMVRDFQQDPVSRRFVHADFVVVDKNKKITVEVPITFVGRAKGVVKGGKLRQVRRLAHVRCLP